MPTAYRYAAYLAPAGAFKDIGSRWLGRCEDTGLALARAAGDDARIDAWTAAPRHYGLHATLKPPFRLAAGSTPQQLDGALRRLARGQQAFGAPLQLRALRGFLAWCQGDDTHAQARMQALADQCVRDLDEFRAPATPEEIARRNPDKLDAAQRGMLERWGYPYVFETFKFHMTLTDNLAPGELEQAMIALHERGAAAPGAPMPVQAVTAYVQPEKQAPFVVARHYGFDGRVRDGAGAAWLQDSA
jgi:hypothetical protein